MPKFFVFIFLLLFFTAGCGSNTTIPGTPVPETAKGVYDLVLYPVTVTDSVGREITIATEPQKVISLSPAITEILFAIGVEEKIIGVTDYCNYPPEALNKPRVGSFQSVNLELIIQSEPDVAFVAAGIQEDFIKQFEDLDIKVVTLDAESLDEIMENIRIAGQVTGAAAKSREVARALEERIEAVREKVARTDSKPTVFFEVWDDPLMTAGPGSFINDLIVMAGGKNIAADAIKRYAEFSLEILVERDPDIYVINDHAHEPRDVMNRPGYQGLKAVQNNRVFAIEDDLVTLPGPRIVDGLEEMAKIIHPELFQ